MTVLGIRFCSVSEQASDLAACLDALGLPRKEDTTADAAFTGAIFPAGSSWVEVWPAGEQMPAGIMLQIVVDDADAYAEQAKRNGLAPHGPMDAHGERIYFLQAPGGLQLSFQSALP